MATELIAEIGLAHEGSLGLAHSYIDVCSEIGIDTVKFQMHIADHESSELEKFRIQFSFKDKTRKEYWKRTEFELSEWNKLIEHAKNKNINFLVSAFSVRAIDNLRKLGLKRIKLGSAESIDPIMRQQAVNKGFELILSNGLDKKNLLQVGVDITKNGNKVSLLECTSAYPSKIEQFNRESFERIQNSQHLIGAGISDHTGETLIAKYGIVKGCDMIEAHITFDKKMFGPDSIASLTPSQWMEIVEFKNGINIINANSQVKAPCTHISKTFSRSMTYSRNLKRGSIIKLDDIESTKMNGEGISTLRYMDIVGKKLTKNVELHKEIQVEDFAEQK